MKLNKGGGILHYILTLLMLLCNHNASLEFTLYPLPNKGVVCGIHPVAAEARSHYIGILNAKKNPNKLAT